MMSNMTFLCLVGISDPIREDVADCIQQLKASKIRTIMITPDEHHSSVAVAKKVGLIPADVTEKDEPLYAMSCEKLSKENDIALGIMLKDNITCFTNCSIDQKRRIVKLLQSLNEVVAATGDSALDADLLIEADVGFALGSASHISQDSADIVLTDDHFGTILSSIKWGRLITASIRRFIQF